MEAREEKTHLGDFVLEHFERDTISVKNNYCENVYLSKGYKSWSSLDPWER